MFFAPPPEKLTWELNGDTLTISGTGPMPDFVEVDTPWADNADDVVNLVIGDGITTIGALAFAELSSLEAVSIGSGVTENMLRYVISEPRVDVVDGRRAGKIYDR